MARIYGRHALVWRGNALHFGRGRNPQWRSRTGLAEIVPDVKYPTMFRVRPPDGSLSDMVNRTRAKDAAISFGLAILNAQETRLEASPAA